PRGSVAASAAPPLILPAGFAAMMAFTAASTLSWPRPLTTTLAPVAARPFAMARPMPAVEPVMSAVLPERSIFIVAPDVNVNQGSAALPVATDRQEALCFREAHQDFKIARLQ